MAIARRDAITKNCYYLLYSLICMLEERTDSARLLVDTTLWRPIFFSLDSSSDRTIGHMEYHDCLVLPDGHIIGVGKSQCICYLHYQAELILLPAIDVSSRNLSRDLAHLLRNPQKRNTSELIRFDGLGHPILGDLIRNGLSFDDLVEQEGSDQLHLAQFNPEAPEALYEATVNHLGLETY